MTGPPEPSPAATGGARTRRPGRGIKVFALLALLIAGIAAYGWHLGYPTGPVYRIVPAKAPTHDASARAVPAGTVALFLSGDMGFNTGMGPQIASHIAARGIPVLAVNSLTAFARRHSREEMAAFVQEAIGKALSMPGARRVLVIGQSFGADALVAGLPGLPAAMRSHIALVALIVPGDTLSYQATPGGVFSWSNDGPALPLARQMDWGPVLCLYGKAETSSLCPLWRAPNVRPAALPGGHFLQEDSALVAARILQDFTDRFAAD
jgi:type IV secretory pathway VirJ component